MTKAGIYDRLLSTLLDYEQEKKDCPHVWTHIMRLEQEAVEAAEKARQRASHIIPIGRTGNNGDLEGRLLSQSVTSPAANNATANVAGTLLSFSRVELHSPVTPSVTVVPPLPNLIPEPAASINTILNSDETEDVEMSEDEILD